MNTNNLPLLPEPEMRGPEVCKVMRLYMGVVRDVPLRQQQRILAHIQECEYCAYEHRLLEEATRLLSGMASSAPSAQVDRAVHRAIAARREARTWNGYSVVPAKQQKKRARWLKPVMAAAMLVLAMAAALYGAPLLLQTGTTAFALPANLSWKPYVLYHTHTMRSADGEPYQVEAYHNLSAGVINVQTVMGGTLDVVVVQDKDQALGLDMMHHIAQWDAAKWSVSDTLFDLDHLRQDLRAGRATYLGKSQFRGQDVYRIRCANGQVLLLDMDYMPVNVINMTAGRDYNKPFYNTLQWLQPSQVPSSMWDMNVPQGFKMGSLPAKP